MALGGFGGRGRGRGGRDGSGEGTRVVAAAAVGRVGTISGKTPEQMRETLSIKNEFTPEEEAVMSSFPILEKIL